MPVSETKVDPRTLVLVAASFAIVAALGVALFVIALPSLNESGKVQIPAKALTFVAGPAKERAVSIDADGPLLFSDVAGGERDIFVQHNGAEPLDGWSAFDARFPGTGRACTLRWDKVRKVFTDPCDASRAVPADGSGLPTYPVRVEKEQVIVDLSLDKRRAGTTTPGTTPTAPGGPLVTDPR